MAMRDDFCAMIISYNRAGKVSTYKALNRAGYSGKVVVVVGDDDPQLGAYRDEFGDELAVFSKADYAAIVDVGDNLVGVCSPLYARAACFSIAKRAGLRYFIMLDDDYRQFLYRWLPGPRFAGRVVRSTMDDLLAAMIDYYISIPALSIAMGQGGDYIGGEPSVIRCKRKVMNSFICSVDRPFLFVGRINDDVSMYTTEGRRGGLFLTIPSAQLNQSQTQGEPGGVTELYLDVGTYVKSFYSVLSAPSCVRVGVLQDHTSSHPRVHHDIDWRFAAPKIIREVHRRSE